jgi:predicted ferric reductase
MSSVRSIVIWAALAAAIGIPLALAATSPLHAWRSAVYVVGGFAGIVALGLMLVQPLLVGGWLPGLSGYRGRRMHLWVGGALVTAIVIHVGGLWIASPPDMIDALTFTSPTPFSPWGVIAMWAILAVAALAAVRHRRWLTPRTWRLAHMAVAVVIIAGSIGHALLIEGAMETVSKAALCALVVAAAVKAIIDIRSRRRSARSG